MLFKKCALSLEIARKWLDICCHHNLFDDSESVSPNLNGFIAHKHDQSIFSLLLKIYNVKTYPFPLYDLSHRNIIALHSGFFEPGVKLPLVWAPGWHGISIRTQWRNSNRKFRQTVSPPVCMSISLDYFRVIKVNWFIDDLVYLLKTGLAIAKRLVIIISSVLRL